MGKVFIQNAETKEWIELGETKSDPNILNFENSKQPAKNFSIDFTTEITPAMQEMIAAIGRLGRSSYAMALEFNKCSKFAKMWRKMSMLHIRQNRIRLIQDEIIGKFLGTEKLCPGCELEDTFCEGRRCEYQAETFFEDKDYGTSYWRALYYVYWDRKKFHNLSLRNKVKLLKP